jgi:transcriptional regulator with XRE-family HTH domain
MWNINNIKTQQKYITERLSNCLNQKEKEKLQLTLVSYSALLDNSGTLIHTQLPNVMDKITNNQYSNKKEKEMVELEKCLFYGDETYIDDNYLSLLIQLCNNVSSTNIADIEEYSFKTVNVSYESMINMSLKFYAQLGDKEIYDNAMKILGDESALNFSKVSRKGMSDCSGLTFNDYIFDKSYCNVTKQNNIFDYQVLNHEIMHGIDFYMLKKTPSENYYGFHEVPTYTIDYLFIDYLESLGLYPEQVKLLRQQKDNYLHSLATITKMQIRRMIKYEKGYKASINPSIKDIKQIINPQLKKQLLEIQSGIMAFGLYQQINQTGDIGLGNLKKFMKTIIPKGETPNFENISLTNELLLECSLMIGKYSKSNDQIGKMK